MGPEHFDIEYETVNWGHVFTMKIPRGWHDHSKDNILSIAAPDNSIAINASVFKLPDMNINTFAELRFNNIYDYLEPHSGAYKIQENNFIGWAKEYIGVKDGEHIFYYVLCLNFTDLFVSLTFTTTPATFKNERELIQDIIESIGFLYDGEVYHTRDNGFDFSKN